MWLAEPSLSIQLDFRHSFKRSTQLRHMIHPPTLGRSRLRFRPRESPPALMSLADFCTSWAVIFRRRQELGSPSSIKSRPQITRPATALAAGFRESNSIPPLG